MLYRFAVSHIINRLNGFVFEDINRVVIVIFWKAHACFYTQAIFNASQRKHTVHCSANIIGFIHRTGYFTTLELMMATRTHFTYAERNETLTRFHGAPEADNSIMPARKHGRQSLTPNTDISHYFSYHDGHIILKILNFVTLNLLYISITVEAKWIVISSVNEQCDKHSIKKGQV